MAYLLDSNILIDAKNHYYGFDICPGFWSWLDHAYADKLILSVKQVRAEILSRGDKLSLWVKNRSKMFVDTNDGKTFESMKLLSTWVVDNYIPAAQAKFLSAADFPLVAYAHAHGHTVVTAEVPSSGIEVKIPNACKALNVGKITTFGMLSAEKVKFHFNP